MSKDLKQVRKDLYKALYAIDKLLDSNIHQDGIKLNSLEECPCCAIESNHFHYHHIVPKSIGGVDKPSNIIRLCEDCHNKIHMKTSLGLSSLIKEGIKKAKLEGKSMGRPRIVDWEKTIDLRKQGFSLGEIAARTGTTRGSVSKILKKSL